MPLRTKGTAQTAIANEPSRLREGRLGQPAQRGPVLPGNFNFKERTLSNPDTCRASTRMTDIENAGVRLSEAPRL